MLEFKATLHAEEAGASERALPRSRKNHTDGERSISGLGRVELARPHRLRRQLIPAFAG